MRPTKEEEAFARLADGVRHGREALPTRASRIAMVAGFIAAFVIALLAALTLR